MNADSAPTYCRFLGTDTCRLGLDIAEHNLEPSGWRHPDDLDHNGRWLFTNKETA